ncbi:MAG: hypothetical protein BWY27_00007 [Bacteroidetes bacterium ADurb.Bin234]|nr:MAG: hypothetical protein BWY27_00007 [Bacteroidetes bacterium ADurb.Bin234]
MTRPELAKYENLNLETLIALAEKVAAEASDGHLTLMRFTTGWKAFLKTPNLDTGDGRKEVADIQMYATLKEALINLLLHGRR